MGFFDSLFKNGYTFHITKNASKKGNVIVKKKRIKKYTANATISSIHVFFCLSPNFSIHKASFFVCFSSIRKFRKSMLFYL